MKQKLCVMLFFMAVLLTGCGQESKLMSYVNLGNLQRLDTKEQIQEATKEIETKDQGKWSYRKENIASIMQMAETIKKTCSNDKTNITFDNAYDGKGIDIWQKHANAGKDPREEEVLDIEILLSMKDKETLLANCRNLVNVGFSCLKDFDYKNKDVNLIQNGYSINITNIESEEDEQEEQEEYPYEIYIQIPGAMAFGPERYFDIFDTCINNGLYVSGTLCCNGAFDGIMLRGEDMKAILYLKDDKLLELSVVQNEWKEGNFFKEQEKTAMVELITHMCKDRNSAISMVNGLQKQGEKNGEIGDFEWSINKAGAMYADGDNTYILTVK